MSDVDRCDDAIFAAKRERFDEIKKWVYFGTNTDVSARAVV